MPPPSCYRPDHGRMRLSIAAPPVLGRLFWLAAFPVKVRQQSGRGRKVRTGVGADPKFLRCCGALALPVPKLAELVTHVGVLRRAISLGHQRLQPLRDPLQLLGSGGVLVRLGVLAEPAKALREFPVSKRVK